MFPYLNILILPLLTSFSQFEILRAVANNDYPTLRRISQSNDSAVALNPALKLRVLDRLFETPPEVQNVSSPEAFDILRIFRGHLRQLSQCTSGSSNPEILELFSVRKQEDSELYLLSKGTPLHSHVHDCSLNVVQATEAGPVLTPEQTCLAIASFVRERMRTQIIAEGKECLKAKPFQTACLMWAVKGSCHRVGCKRVHWSPTEVTDQDFTSQFRPYLLQMMISQVQCVRTHPNTSTKAGQTDG
jgi:hypothetical protein